MRRRRFQHEQETNEEDEDFDEELAM
eukprot:SAG11_NODE_26615_length_343_cov_0.631148_2_plen_25_part_01